MFFNLNISKIGIFVICILRIFKNASSKVFQLPLKIITDEEILKIFFWVISLNRREKSLKSKFSTQTCKKKLTYYYTIDKGI